jgi:Ala-tRNA(Pro) deacylase
MPATEADLYARLDALGIAHRTHRHRAVFTVEESRDLKAKIPGGHSKNLFLKDKKGAIFLLSALGDSQIDLNAVSKLLGVGRFSFGNAELLMQYLGVTPGSVTLFGLINDSEARVRVVLDEGFFGHALVNFHPLSNEATTAITPADMLKFVEACGRTPIRLSFAPDGTPSLIDPPAPTAHVEP